MSRHQTYRVLVTKSDVYQIDLAAPNETVALSHAERLWNSGSRSRFQRDEELDAVSYAIDDGATLHQRDFANEDRARWAKNALQAFSNETKSSMGQEALHDLLCDLGHYARERGLDFQAEMLRAVDVCEAEIAEEVQS
jgi:hypothetical protein